MSHHITNKQAKFPKIKASSILITCAVALLPTTLNAEPKTYSQIQIEDSCNYRAKMDALNICVSAKASNLPGAARDLLERSRSQDFADTRIVFAFTRFTDLLRPRLQIKHVIEDGVFWFNWRITGAIGGSVITRTPDGQREATDSYPRATAERHLIEIDKRIKDIDSRIDRIDKSIERIGRIADKDNAQKGTGWTWERNSGRMAACGTITLTKLGYFYAPTSDELKKANLLKCRPAS